MLKMADDSLRVKILHPVFFKQTGVKVQKVFQNKSASDLIYLCRESALFPIISWRNYVFFVKQCSNVYYFSWNVV